MTVKWNWFNLGENWVLLKCSNRTWTKMYVAMYIFLNVSVITSGISVPTKGAIDNDLCAEWWAFIQILEKTHGYETSGDYVESHSTHCDTSWKVDVVCDQYYSLHFKVHMILQYKIVIYALVALRKRSIYLNFVDFDLGNWSSGCHLSTPFSTSITG